MRVLFAEADYVYGILPAHAFQGTKVVGSAWEDSPFGTGPFRVARWFRGDSIVLEPNPYYAPRPRLKQIVLRIVPNLNTNFVALQSGSADIGTLTPENVENAARLPGITVQRVPENATGLLYMQTQAPPTNDLHVRRAIAYALDLDALANAWRRQYPTATSFLPPPIVTWKSVVIQPYPHDLAAANRELDLAGWKLQNGERTKNGTTLNGLMGINAEDPLQPRIATLVQSQLAAIGMRLSIKANPSRVFFSPDGLLRDGKATLVQEPWVGGSDPEQSLNFQCAQAVKGDANHAFYCSKRFDALVADQAVASTEAKRAEDFNAIQVLIHDDVPQFRCITNIVCSA